MAMPSGLCKLIDGKQFFFSLQALFEFASESIDIQKFILAIRITSLRNPCHPIFRESDGSFFVTISAIKTTLKRKKPMSDIGGSPVITGFVGWARTFKT